MAEAAAANLLTGLARAIEDGDAVRARRRLGELNAVLKGLPVPALRDVQSRLQPLLERAEQLRGELQASLGDRPRQRRSVGAYRRMAGQV